MLSRQSPRLLYWHPEPVRKCPLIFTGRLSALQHPRYRRYWLGSFASVGATQLNTMSQGWLIFSLTGSSLMLGYLGAAASIPAIVMTLFGGALADRLNKKYVLMCTSMTVTVFVIAGLVSFTSGLDQPTRQSIFPSLIERDDMMSAVALNSIIWQSCRMVMPAIGGLILASFNTAVVFTLCSLGYLTMFFVMVSLNIHLPRIEIKGSTLNQVAEGLRFILHNRLFLVLITLSYCAMFFANAHMQLMPAFAKLLGAHARGFGYLLSATGVGSVTGTIIVGSLQESHHLGKIILGAAASAACCVLAFCLVTGTASLVPFAYVLALLTVFSASVFSSIFMISLMTVLQLRVPDHLRGRVMGFHGITYSLMPLGALLAGTVASFTSPPVAIAIGLGVYMMIIAAIAISQAEVRNIRAAHLAPA